MTSGGTDGMQLGATASRFDGAFNREDLDGVTEMFPQDPITDGLKERPASRTHFKTPPWPSNIKGSEGVKQLLGTALGSDSAQGLPKILGRRFHGWPYHQ